MKNRENKQGVFYIASLSNLVRSSSSQLQKMPNRWVNAKPYAPQQYRTTEDIAGRVL
jgi:hypothetical protein